MIRRAETVGCWLWDSYRYLVVVALTCQVAVALVMNDWSPYARRALLGVLLSGMALAWLWGLWADGRRQATRAKGRRLVVDMRPEVYADLVRYASQVGYTLGEFVKRGVALYWGVVAGDDSRGADRFLEVLVRDRPDGPVRDAVVVYEGHLVDLPPDIRPVEAGG